MMIKHKIFLVSVLMTAIVPFRSVSFVKYSNNQMSKLRVNVKGISHSPKEYTRIEDVANGVNVLLFTILKIDQGALD